MLMQGDINKILIEVNKVLDVAFNKIEALEARLEALETPKSTKKEKKAA